MGQVEPVGGARPQQGAPRVTPFGKYLLLDRLAVGGMAEVYTAKAFGIEGFEKFIAIKRILPTMAEDPDFISMFIDEAKIAGHLTHANIVPIYELGKIGDSHYIAMEYVWGKDLLQIMNRFRRMRRHMPPVMAAWIASKMLEALDYSHRKRDRHGRPMGIIHRDVSPQNCLVSYEGQVKVIDFGIAKAASRDTKTQAGVLKGKFGYMSPEQVRGLPIDHRSDIFASSTCLHEMLTGERLFVGESDFSTLEKVRNAEVVPPSRMLQEMPAELEDIVLKGLTREPDDRWQTAGEMQEALQRFIALHKPPFGTSKLNTWMRTAFAQEIAKEKAKLDRFNNVSHPAGEAAMAPPSPGPRVPAAPVAAAPAPSAPAPSAPTPQPGPGEELTAEATMISASPFDAAEEQAEELAEQATQIFFSADDLTEVPDEDSPGSVPIVDPAPVSPVRNQAIGNRVGLPQPKVVPPAPVPPVVASGPSVGEQRNVSTVEVQRVPANAANPFPTAPAEKKKSGNKWVILLGIAAMLVLAAGISGGLYLFGGARTGTISIGQPPAGVDATVYINGVLEGNAPIDLDVPEGDYQVQIRAENYEERSGQISVVAAQTFVMPAELRPATGNRPLSASSLNITPPTGLQPGTGAATPPPTLGPEEGVAPEDGVAPEEGPEGVEATATPVVEPGGDGPGPAAALAVVTPRPTAPTPTAVAPTPTRTPTPRRTPTPPDEAATARPGRRPRPSRPARAASGDAATRNLVIQTLPWARVFIDGRDTGRNTPVRGLSVSLGAHRLGFRTTDGVMHNIDVTVEAGDGPQRIVRQL